MFLYLIRHGEPDYVTDTLTEAGWQQARLAAERLAESGIDEIHASPMGRAQQTAQPTAEKLGLPVVTEPWAYELGEDCKTLFPDGKLKTVSSIPVEYLHSPAFRAMDSLEGIAKIEGIAETAIAGRFKMISEGMDAMLEKMGFRRTPEGLYEVVAPSDRHMALFCHAGMMRVMLAHAMNLPFHLLAGSLMPHFTGITILEFKGSSALTSPVMLCYGDAGHLFGKGLKNCHYTSKKPF